MQDNVSLPTFQHYQLACIACHIKALATNWRWLDGLQIFPCDQLGPTIIPQCYLTNRGKKTKSDLSVMKTRQGSSNVMENRCLLLNFTIDSHAHPLSNSMITFFLYIYKRSFGHVNFIANPFSLKFNAPTHFLQNCDL